MREWDTGTNAGTNTDTSPARGEPTALVALPGTFCCPAVVFEPLVEQLHRRAPGRLAPRSLSWMTDAPAWSLPEVADWVACRITAEERHPVLLLGHSTGGAIALQLALCRPELVRGLILVDTGANMHRHGDVAALLRRMETEGTAEVARAVVDRSFHAPPTDADRARLLDYAGAAPARAALEVLGSQQATDFLPRLHELTMPVAVVHGRFDPVRDVTEASALAGAIPRSTLQVVDAGHSPTYEAPATVAAVTIELERAGAPG